VLEFSIIVDTIFRSLAKDIPEFSPEYNFQTAPSNANEKNVQIMSFLSNTIKKI
jgi:hypothetical protein